MSRVHITMTRYADSFELVYERRIDNPLLKNFLHFLQWFPNHQLLPSGF